MNKHVWLGLTIGAVLVLSGCTGQNNISSGENTSDNTTQSTTEGFNSVKSKGSCNSINIDSQCVDYVGSVWTKQVMELHCGSGKSGVLSANPCPSSENGGCRTGADTESEAIIWSYPYGGSPVMGDNLISTKKICEVTPGFKWINS